jgi:hypothetical protein
VPRPVGDSGHEATELLGSSGAGPAE